MRPTRQPREWLAHAAETIAELADVRSQLLAPLIRDLRRSSGAPASWAVGHRTSRLTGATTRPYAVWVVTPMGLVIFDCDGVLIDSERIAVRFQSPLPRRDAQRRHPKR